MSYIRLLDMAIGSNTKIANPWVKLILENQFVRRGCPKAYKHMIQFILNPCGTLES